MISTDDTAFAAPKTARWMMVHVAEIALVYDDPDVDFIVSGKPSVQQHQNGDNSQVADSLDIPSQMDPEVKIPAARGQLHDRKRGT